MAVDKFKFVSPGIFIDEIDESALQPLPDRMGPVVIGRFQKGPSNRPVKVDSYKEFVQVFGAPAPGTAKGDIWRTGDQTAPTYAAYAAQAWLKNNSPCTVIRLLGKHPSDAADTQLGRAGWITDNTPNTDIAQAGGAYGLFVMPNPDEYTGGSEQAVYTDAIDFASYGTSDDFTINVPAAAGGTGTTMTIRLTGADATGAASTSATVIAMGVSSTPPPSAGTVAETIVDAINGFFGSGGAYNHSFASANTGVNTGVAGVTATLSGTTKITLTADIAGQAGNNIQVTDGTGSPATTGKLAGGGGPAVTGSLAAVWYVQDGAVILTGTARDGKQREGAAVLIKAGTGQTFTAKVVRNGADSSDWTVDKTATFDFVSTSEKYIRKVFNTDPTLTNDALYSSPDLKYHWLGETFETHARSEMYVTGTAVSAETNKFYGVILGLNGTGGSTGAGFDWHDRKRTNAAANTGWFISQDIRGEVTADAANGFDPTNAAHAARLFRFHALDSGESGNRDLKISIEDVKVPTDNFNTYGSFTVLVRRGTDNDNKLEVLERYSGVNLDPTSTNFIRKAVGDRQYSFDASTNVLTEIGQYANRSKYVRVETSPGVDAGAGEGLHPFGVFGPVVPKTFQLLSGSVADALSDDSGAAVKDYVIGSGSTFPSGAFAVGQTVSMPTAQLVWHGPMAADNQFTASLRFPTPRARISSSEGGLVKANKAYFGYQSNLVGAKKYDYSNLDMLRGRPLAFNNGDASGIISSPDEYQYSWVFTLDDVKQATDDTSHAVWVSGSRADGSSWTAQSGSNYVVKDLGFNRFTAPMAGGFDGFDVTEKDPLRNSRLLNGTELSNSGFYTIKKAIDMIADREFLEFDVAAVPGVTNTGLTTALVNACEDRGDALAIIDLKHDYTPPHDTNVTDNAESSRLGSVSSAVNALKDMNVNSSYGCAFYPYVQIKDTGSDSILYVPPSVVALGTFSSSQKKSAVWFAPAGFTRGGLSEGSAGIPVLGVRKRLTASDRDELYDANINPIASFPAEGVVIFGQKTLQVTQSALDRINVRRLLIYLKKEISRIASTILFEQNVQATWDSFTSRVNPLLEDVRAAQGLMDFKVVLDNTTTTDELIDRNVMYAKIYLKPARAIEFIALDFIITRSGASFDD